MVPGELRIGVHIYPDTDYTTVPHCFTEEVPQYNLEILRKGEWTFFRAIKIEELDEEVYAMHHMEFNGISGLRLMENGYPVFCTYGMED